MALLSLGHSEDAEGLTSLLLVPTNHLAVQYFEWIYLLTRPSDSAANTTTHTRSTPSLVDPSIAQLFIREASLGDPNKHIDALASTPPQLLVATPQRLIDLLIPKPPKARDISRLKLPPHDRDRARKTSAHLREILLRTRLVALDEADALLSLPPRFSTRKQRELFQVHPPPAVTLLGHCARPF
jgi:superfamily II DNA/RNA helicase